MEPIAIGCQEELQRLRMLSQRVGRDPLLTQGSTGNSSAKLNGVLWIKASGKWMADAVSDEIFIPLNLTGVKECLRQQLDPTALYPGASLETALHAALPHRLVLHVHCVNTIAWAVQRDAPVQLQRPLDGLRWRWIPYVASGLALSREIERALAAQPDTDVFVLGNHGLILGAANAEILESLLIRVKRCLALSRRQPRSADYGVLQEISKNSSWQLPEDEGLHALGTDAISGAILAGGLLYPCQAILSDSRTQELFRPIPFTGPGEFRKGTYRNRQFLIIQGCGVVVSRSIAPAELAMISGLAQVVQRLNATTLLRYLTEAEIAGIPGPVAYRYRELASMRNGSPH